MTCCVRHLSLSVDRVLRLIRVARISPPSPLKAEEHSTVWVDSLVFAHSQLMDVGVAGGFHLLASVNNAIPAIACVSGCFGLNFVGGTHLRG